MHSNSTRTTIAAAGAVALLTLISTPASAALPPAQVSAAVRGELSLEELSVFVTGLRLLDSELLPESTTGSQDATVAEAAPQPRDATVAEAAPQPQALVQNWKYPAGDLPRGKAVPIKNFWISAPFGNRGPHTGGIHAGLDFAADSGSPIYSVTAGKVVKAGWMGNAGVAAIVRTPGNQYVLYGHMSKMHVKKGQNIKAGKEIGRVGTTGNSTGPHLHLQVTPGKNRNAIDPLPWLGVSRDQLDVFGSD